MLSICSRMTAEDCKACCRCDKSFSGIFHLKWILRHLSVASPELVLIVEGGQIDSLHVWLVDHGTRITVYLWLFQLKV